MSALRFSQQTEKASYSGIGRATYFLVPIALFLLLSSGTFFFQPPQQSGQMPVGSSAIGVLLLFCLLVFSVIWPILRLINIGKSAWYVLLFLVPLANIYVALLCAIAPPGYAHSKKLDTAAIVLACLILAFWLISLGWLIVNH